MKRLLAWTLITAAAAGMLAGCVAPSGVGPVVEPSSTPVAPDPTATLMAAPATPDTATRERLLATMAISDLAARLQVSPDSVKVVSIVEQDWPDASVGCPAPDMAYAQMITPGVEVVLSSDGQEYSYHGRDFNTLFLCGPDGPVPPLD